MKIIIVGAGKLARYLTETLISFEKDYQIILIEKIEEIGAEIANKFESVRVLQGDGTDIKVLTDADAENADYYIAVTGKDEDNLVGCHIAKTIFHVRNTVAHVNNPANIELFELLKVDHVYSRSVILADIIEQDIAQEGMTVIYKIPHQKNNILEVELSPTSAAVGRTLAEYKFPDETRVALLIHDDGSTEVPRGNSIMLEGDRLLLVTTSDDYDEIFNELVKN